MEKLSCDGATDMSEVDPTIADTGHPISARLIGHAARGLPVDRIQRNGEANP